MRSGLVGLPIVGWLLPRDTRRWLRPRALEGLLHWPHHRGAGNEKRRARLLVQEAPALLRRQAGRGALDQTRRLRQQIVDGDKPEARRAVVTGSHDQPRFAVSYPRTHAELFRFAARL